MSSDSKNASKSDLNESNMPLLEDDGTEKCGETPEKEQIEMKEDIQEKDDSNEKEKDEKKKKKKKEKKPKGPKEPKGKTCVEKLSENLDLSARDPSNINEAINVDFDDVLAEPRSTMGFDPVWKLSFVLFTCTKVFLYRVISAVIALPAAIFWGLIFSLLTLIHVWMLAPALRIFDLVVAVVRRVWTGVVSCTLEPVCSAIGSVFAKMNVHQHRRMVQEV